MTYPGERSNLLWSLCSPKAASILFDVICDFDEAEGGSKSAGIFDLYAEHRPLVMETMETFGKSEICLILEDSYTRRFLWFNQ